MTKTPDLLLRLAVEADAPEIIALYAEAIGDTFDPALSANAIVTGHGVVLVENDKITGFRVANAVAGDVLGDGTMFVAEDRRGGGRGRAIVDFYEETTPERFRLMMLTNSDLVKYQPGVEKLPATGFWLSCGYELVADTGATRLFIKERCSTCDSFRCGCAQTVNAAEISMAAPTPFDCEAGSSAAA